MGELTEADRQQIKDYLSHPVLFPADFKNWVQDYVAMNIPKITVNQIMGFELWSIHSDSVETSQNTSSTSFTSLGTVGPKLSNLPNGFYVALWGAMVGAYNTNIAHIGLSVDGAAPGSDQDAFGQMGAIGSAALLDLTAGNGTHSLELKYKVSASNRDFQGRFLHALRVVT